MIQVKDYIKLLQQLPSNAVLFKYNCEGVITPAEKPVLASSPEMFNTTPWPDNLRGRQTGILK